MSRFGPTTLPKMIHKCFVQSQRPRGASFVKHVVDPGSFSKKTQVDIRQVETKAKIFWASTIPKKSEIVESFCLGATTCTVVRTAKTAKIPPKQTTLLMLCLAKKAFFPKVR